jgi:hypothetical protein
MARVLDGVIVSLLMVVVMGCGPGPGAHLKASKVNLTAGQAKSKFEVGKTTQLDVVRAFGAPNMVLAKSGAGEVWTYDQVSVTDEACGVLGGAFLVAGGPWEGWGAGAGAGLAAAKQSKSSSVRTVTLIIEFDSKEVLKNYEILVTAF